MESSKFDSIARIFADRRLSRRQAVQGAGVLAAGTLATAGLTHAAAQEATPLASPVAGAETEKVSFLFVQSFGAGSIASGDDGKLTLTADHLAGQTIYFSDRPERIVGMVSTEKFLGTATPKITMSDGTIATPSPDSGLGFNIADPPNAALVFESAEGSDEPGDVLVVELIDPTYDPATGKATYEINVLADDTAVGMTLVGQSTAMADAIRDFSAASLFIDDCPDGTLYCYIPNQDPGQPGPDFGTAIGNHAFGYCWDWGGACCKQCNGNFPNDCAAFFPDNGCGAWDNGGVTWYPCDGYTVGGTYSCG